MGRTAGQTLVLALVTLGAMGCVCSLTTRSLHRVVTWFAPINGEPGIAPLPSPPLPSLSLMIPITDCKCWHRSGYALRCWC